MDVIKSIRAELLELQQLKVEVSIYINARKHGKFGDRYITDSLVTKMVNRIQKKEIRICNRIRAELLPLLSLYFQNKEFSDYDEVVFIEEILCLRVQGINVPFASISCGKESLFDLLYLD